MTSDPDKVKRPDRVTLWAQQDCTDWLRYCFSIGWPRETLDDLENLWWKWHDKKGRLLHTQSEDAK